MLPKCCPNVAQICRIVAEMLPEFCQNSPNFVSELPRSASFSEDFPAGVLGSSSCVVYAPCECEDATRPGSQFFYSSGTYPSHPIPTPNHPPPHHKFRSEYCLLLIGFVGNGREETGLVGVSLTVGRSIVSEDAIRSGIAASYANPKPQRLRLGLAKMVSPSK